VRALAHGTLTMTLHDHWYVAARSADLRAGQVRRVTVMARSWALFRGQDGAPAALEDRCRHRAGRLSSGCVQGGALACPYHGWRYGPGGDLRLAPSEGDATVRSPARAVPTAPVVEQDGLIYLCPGRPPSPMPSFRVPDLTTPGFRAVRLHHRVDNDVAACVQNFLDVPHTPTVHPGVFRDARAQRLTMTVRREGTTVSAEYVGEHDNLGWFRRLLNPTGASITHRDRFVGPNITWVTYTFPRGRRAPWVLHIVSQCTPVGPWQTDVYTDVTFRYGAWTALATPLVAWTSRRIIAEDLRVLADQAAVRRELGERAPCSTPADVLHGAIDAVIAAMADDAEAPVGADQTVAFLA
jgi:phenylpropionate dioxygenase-like ring-hydroxylating dioxygenase large terminal subunit